MRCVYDMGPSGNGMENRLGSRQSEAIIPFRV